MNGDYYLVMISYTWLDFEKENPKPYAYLPLSVLLFLNLLNRLNLRLLYLGYEKLTSIIICSLCFL
jgi:hypothetical protein